MQEILRLPAVQRRTGLSRSAVYEAMKDGDFPKQINLGIRTVGWISAEVDEWIASRINASRFSNISIEKRAFRT